MSNAGFGAWFSGVSVVSAVLLPRIGKLVDRVDLRLIHGDHHRFDAHRDDPVATIFGDVVVRGRDISCAILRAGPVHSYRQHRYGPIFPAGTRQDFPQERGKALSLSGLGLASGEAILPSITVGLIFWLGWREAWLATGAVVAIMAVMLLPVFLRGYGERRRGYEARQSSCQDEAWSGEIWTRRQVLLDPGFYALMALLLSFPYMATAIFFHQGFIANLRGWSPELLAGGFDALAVMKVVTSVILGPLIDRYSATRLVLAIAIPFSWRCWPFWCPTMRSSRFVYLGLFGVTIGMLQPINSAMLAERYGVAHLGAIRSMAIAVMVFAAAAAPVPLGWLLDAAVPINLIIYCFVAYVVVTGLGAQVILRREKVARSASDP